MANFKFVISKGNRSLQIEKDQKESPVIGKKIGETVSGDFLGLEGYELKITGGSDNSGFAMLPDVESMTKRAIILTRGRGFSGSIRGKKKTKPPHFIEGLRKRKTVRGNTITAETSQINCAVVKEGTKPLEFPEKKAEEKKEGAT